MSQQNPHPAEAVTTGPPQVPAQHNAVLEHAAETCSLGTLTRASVITTGFEDCNLDIHTTRGRFVVKIFAGRRGATTGPRTAEILQRVIAAGVQHPRLHADASDQILHHHKASGSRYLVMDFVAARDFYALQRGPTPAELRRILEQAALVHGIDHHPEFVSDPWAITNLQPLARQVDAFLDTEQRHLVRIAIERAAHVDRSRLPHTLIHGDLTKGNVLADDDAGITLIDFSVANHLPRIQELIVLAANLTHGCPQPMPERAAAIAKLYSQLNPLSDHELEAVGALAPAAAAMEFLGAAAERHIAHNCGPETEYLIDLGLAGLRDCVR